MTNLTSRNNPKIKQIHQLVNQRKQRQGTGLFVVEGIHHVGEACASQAGVEYLVYAPNLLSSDFAFQLIGEQSELGIPCYAVNDELFNQLASKDNPQGIMAVVRQPHWRLEEMSADKLKWAVALVAPQDPGNIGTILRTVDAVGAGGLLLLDDPDHKQFSADPYHPSSVRASMGAIFWYPVISSTFSNFAAWARTHSYHVYGTSAHSNMDYRSFTQYELPLILLMGSERDGLLENQSAICDQMVRIPMQGRVTSLNLAVATGVMLYSIYNKMV